MKTRKRAWWFVNGFAVVCGLMIYVFLSLSEHSDYKRAAEGLPEARRRAEAVIGPMTWEEYRKERGVEGSDDYDEWFALEKSIPPEFEEFERPWRETVVRMKVADLFRASREWLFSLAAQVEPLRLTHQPGPADAHGLHGDVLLASRGIAMRAGKLLIGAADAGDAEAVREAGKVCWMIIERQFEECDLDALVISGTNLRQIEEDIVRAAVRNSKDEGVMKALRSVMASMPEQPSYYDAVIGEARTCEPLLEEIRSLAPGDIDRWLDESSERPPEYEDNDLLARWTRALVAQFSDEPYLNRKVGGHTGKAFACRFYESIVESADAAKTISYSAGDGHVRLEQLEHFIDFGGDRSYEFVGLRFPLRLGAQDANAHLAMHGATAIALELISRYPELDSLPTKLPPDLNQSDPFGGRPLLYRKTEHGFLIYSRWKNRLDDGFVPPYNTLLQFEVRTAWSDGGDDWALVVAYDDPHPMP